VLPFDSYALDVHVDRAEDVLLHRNILIQCQDPDKRPIFHARFLKVLYFAFAIFNDHFGILAPSEICQLPIISSYISGTPIIIDRE
jgi:hypothetical protein